MIDYTSERERMILLNYKQGTRTPHYTAYVCQKCYSTVTVYTFNSTSDELEKHAETHKEEWLWMKLKTGA